MWCVVFGAALLVALGMPACRGSSSRLLDCSGGQGKGGQYHKFRKAVEDLWMELEEDLSRDEAGLYIPPLYQQPPGWTARKSDVYGPLLHYLTNESKSLCPCARPAVERLHKG